MFEKLHQNLKARIKDIFPDTDIQEIIDAAFGVKKPVSFRVNFLRSNVDEIKKALDLAHISYSEGNVFGSFIAKNIIERDIWNLDIYTSGKIYLQSLSSQLPATFLDTQKHQNVLDVTAAPGGKTSQISAIMENTGHIDACDISHIRVEKMKYNLKKLGCNNVSVHQVDARKLESTFSDANFSRILFDAPCSSEGGIEYTNSKFLSAWDEKHIINNAQRQKEIISQIVHLLQDSGIFVYSTCTLAPEENEEIVEYILNTYPDLEIQDIFLDFEFAIPGIDRFGGKTYDTRVKKSLRIIPNPLCEGFFIAKFQKVGLEK